MAGSDGLWYGARIYGETARPLPFPNHQAMPEKRGMGNRLSCYYKETTGTPNRHHRFLSPGAFSLKIRNHIIVLWRISGTDQGSGGGGAASVRLAPAQCYRCRLPGDQPDAAYVEVIGTADRKLPNPNAAVSLVTLLLSQTLHVGDRARVPRRKKRSHRCSAAAGDEPCRGSRSRLGFLVAHSTVFRRRTIILRDQKGAARNCLPRCQHQIAHHRWKQQSLTALASCHHCCCW